MPGRVDVAPRNRWGVKAVEVMPAQSQQRGSPAVYIHTEGFADGDPYLRLTQNYITVSSSIGPNVLGVKHAREVPEALRLLDVDAASARAVAQMLAEEEKREPALAIRSL